MIVGIVAAKANSIRFPDKNIFVFKGKPLFWHSVQPLLDAKLVDKVYVVTDSQYIKGICDKNMVDVIWRPKNATLDADPLLSILKFAYYNLNDPYEMIATIMANCPGHTSNMVDQAILMMKSGKYLEIRSFNDQNEESGLMVFNKVVINNYSQISSHIGSIKSNVHEIHYKEDLNEF